MHGFNILYFNKEKSITLTEFVVNNPIPVKRYQLRQRMTRTYIHTHKRKKTLRTILCMTVESWLALPLRVREQVPCSTYLHTEGDWLHVRTFTGQGCITGRSLAYTQGQGQSDFLFEQIRHEPNFSLRYSLSFWRKCRGSSHKRTCSCIKSRRDFHLYPLVWVCGPTNACPVRPGVNLKSFLFW